MEAFKPSLKTHDDSSYSAVEPTPSSGEAINEVSVIPYKPQYKSDFKRLNVEWITKYFSLEPIDYELFSDPERYFLQPGGYIYFAQYCGDIVGTCALLKHYGRGFELSKMGVTRLWRGMGIGRLLAETCISQVQSLGEKELFLETHSQLIVAMYLYKKLGFSIKPFPYGHSERYERADTYMVLAL